MFAPVPLTCRNIGGHVHGLSELHHIYTMHGSQRCIIIRLVTSKSLKYRIRYNINILFKTFSLRSIFCKMCLRNLLMSLSKVLLKINYSALNLRIHMCCILSFGKMCRKYQVKVYLSNVSLKMNYSD